MAARNFPKNWVIDWSRFVGVSPHDSTDGLLARVARKIDTALAPPLGTMVKEGNDKDRRAPRRCLPRVSRARRNLRRGYNLRLPTGQALHAHLKQNGAVQSVPIADISAMFNAKPEVARLPQELAVRFFERTPLWFYILAEAESGGGNRLGRGRQLPRRVDLRRRSAGGLLISRCRAALSLAVSPVDERQ